jgi:hypothetical protein
MECFQASRTVLGEFALGVFGSLYVDPLAQLVPVLDESLWDASVALTIDEQV